MKYTIIIVATACWFIIGIIGCNSNSNTAYGVWNEKTSTFSIEEENVKYILPSDISEWGIAKRETLPPSMDFFGIDTSAKVCVGIFRPDYPLNGTKSSVGYSLEEIHNLVRSISLPQSDQKVILDELEGRPLSGEDFKTWYFTVNRKIIEQSNPIDTFTIYYSGYIFDGNSRPFGLVIISSVDPSDSIGKSVINKYVSGLKLKK